ncbi:MAG: hypothetical protein BGN88_14275 [Clostridiales bacterium 43-6]|nr:MAG: hypothetical protein BGN88_14275 [Clostridiales bacterium 43-6]
MQQISTEKAPQAIGPYSQATGFDRLIFTSGQIPLVPETGEIVIGDVAVQTAQVLNNLKAVLEAAESGMDKVIKTTVYIKNMNDFPVINRVYETYFSQPFPARSTVEVARLPKDVLVEIEAIAYR